jgi:hypothetical protein
MTHVTLTPARSARLERETEIRVSTPEPYVTSFDAAIFLGYKPKSASARDLEMHAFYEFASRNLREQKHKIGGRLLFRLSEIDAKVQSMTVVDPTLAVGAVDYSDAIALAHEVAAGRYMPESRRVRRFPRASGGRS